MVHTRAHVGRIEEAAHHSVETNECAFQNCEPEAIIK